MKTYYKYIFLLLLTFLSFSSIALADMVYPSLYVPMGMIRYYIVILNFIISIIFVKIITNETSKTKIISISIILVLLLTLAGFLIIPITGLVAELAFIWLNTPTFGLISWCIEYFAIVLVYSVIDSIVFKTTCELPFKKTFLKTLLYNMITIGLAVIEVSMINDYSM